jgi:hypothetical protein
MASHACRRQDSRARQRPWAEPRAAWHGTRTHAVMSGGKRRKILRCFPPAGVQGLSSVVFCYATAPLSRARLRVDRKCVRQSRKVASGRAKRPHPVAARLPSPARGRGAGGEGDSARYNAIHAYCKTSVLSAVKPVHGRGVQGAEPPCEPSLNAVGIIKLQY